MLRALWTACERDAAAGGGSAALERRRVGSLAALEAEVADAGEGAYDAIVVSAGAATGTVSEAGAVILNQIFCLLSPCEISFVCSVPCFYSQQI